MLQATSMASKSGGERLTNPAYSSPPTQAAEEWSKAAAALAGIDLDSGMRLLDAEYKLGKNIQVRPRGRLRTPLLQLPLLPPQPLPRRLRTQVCVRAVVFVWVGGGWHKNWLSYGCLRHVKQNDEGWKGSA